MPKNNYNNNNNNKKYQGNKGHKSNVNRNNNNNNYRNSRNIYEVCGMVKRYIGDTCNKHQIDPSELYEELHYQLPADWVEGLRYIIRNSARIQVKREFDISSSESSAESAI